MQQLTEYIGYAASAGVLVSFLMKDIRTLRIVNSIGCLLFIAYGVLFDLVPVIVTNVAIVGVNLFYLLRPKKTV